MPARKPYDSRPTSRPSNHNNNNPNNPLRTIRHPAPITRPFVFGTGTPRPRPSVIRPPSVITESSTRRNRLTLIASRRRTSLPTTSNVALTRSPRREGDTGNHNDDTANEQNGHNVPQRITLTSYANSIIRHTANRDESPFRRSQIRSKATFSIPNLEQGSVSKVLEGSDKYLPKIFRFLNWNEMLPMRTVCKKWLDVISSNPSITDRLGVIVIQSPWEDQLELFNESPVIWTKFRINTTMYIDLMDTIQLQFWMKHGPIMKFLEIKNKSMTLTGLVEILSRCPNLSHFLVNWTPEMYSFNSELIKRYYGINFYNGSFEHMQEFIVERSCCLNDNALMSILKWCGGTLKSLSLTYPPEDQQNPLTRLKPRWTIGPIRNYLDRFGYTGNLRYLNFSWSNLSPEDLRSLGNVEYLTMLKGVILNHCKVNDVSVAYFLAKKGTRLERLELEDIPLTEAVFWDNSTVLAPRLKSLSISGSAGNFRNLTFLNHMKYLEDLHAANTTWLDYNKLMPILKPKVKPEQHEHHDHEHNEHPLLKLDIAGSLKVNGSYKIDPNMDRVWFLNLITTLPHVVCLNLNQLTQFGKNDNFSMICKLMPSLQELRLKDWKELSDTGVTGLPTEKLQSTNKIIIASKEQKDRVFVGSLKNLRTLDLSGCIISDSGIKYGINSVPNLRKFAFNNTQVSDIGIENIIKRNQTIDQINFRGCEKVVKNKLQKFERPDGRFIHTENI